MRVLLTVLLVFAFPAVAEAGTTLVLPDGTERPEPYQGWVDRAKVKTPDVVIVLRTEECPGAPIAQGCTDGATIWLPEPDKFALLHEVGHTRDDHMTAWRRSLFRRIVRSRRYDDEAFADAYAACALGLRIRRGEIAAFNRYQPTRAQHRRVCRLLR